MKRKPPANSYSRFLPLPRQSFTRQLTIKELKSGLHLGRMQVTKESKRVERSVTLSIMAYLLLVRLYGHKEPGPQAWSLFKLKERFIGEVAQDAVRRTARKWQRKWKQLNDVA
jgi:hypothetical protein